MALLASAALAACGDGGEGGTVTPGGVCGDGTVDSGEQCDDGNTDDGDGCAADCTNEGGGGDTELCDDGIDNDGDGQTDCDDADCAGNASCETTDPVCGDGVVEGGEQCDDGNTDDGDGCAADCTLEETDPVCGDGAVEGDEECDDGNTDDGDGCAADCTLEETDPVCGDGAVEGDEECDDGNTDDGDGCAADCTLEEVGPVCGDGNLDDGEECDDGNNDDGDGCAADCTVEIGETCGDGVVDDGEECDDSGESATCNRNCTIAECGDGLANASAGEECDGRGETATCNDDCTFATCGDAVLNDTAGEECDDGNTDDGDGCAADCTFEIGELCGDGNLDEGEECDDGNNDAGDGCGPNCRIEVIAPFCGDGTVDEDEQCDDGDDNSDSEPNACRTDCTFATCGDGVVDDGETCDGSEDCLDDCTLPPACGNNQVDDGEDCDDGINNSDLIPNACRTDCSFPACGDEVVDTDFGEECDLGDANGPEAECTAECAVNLASACVGVPDFFVLNDVATADGDGFLWDGSFDGATPDINPPVGCVEGDRLTDTDVMVVFNPPADGAYRITTNTPGNVSDTVIYRVSDCQDPIPGVCSDNTGGDFGSTLLLDGLRAGGNVFFVIDRIAGSSTSFQLAVEPIGGIANEGDDCSAADVFCTDGLLCLEGTCQVNAAPVLTSVVAEAVSPTTVRHTLTGTDANRDVAEWFLETATFADGGTLDAIVPTVRPRVSYEGDTFTLVFEIDYPALCAALGEACSTIPTNVSLYVIDDRGNESSIVGATVTPWTDPETGLGEGDDCDITRRANVCDAPFTCTLNVDETTTCGDPAAPFLDEVLIERISATGVRLFMNGTDANGDVTEFLLDGLDIGGAVIPGNEDVALGFDLTSIGLTEFGLVATLNGDAFAPGAGFAQLRLSLLDEQALESNEVTIAIPNPAGVTLGSPCDLDGVTAVCSDGSVCSPDGDGGGICAAPVPPEIVTLEAQFDNPADPTNILVQIIGRDANADVTGLTLAVNTDDGRFVDFGEFASGLCQPDPAGRSAFDCSFEIPLAVLPVIEVPWFSVTVELLDSAGLGSGTVTDGIAPEGGEGELCDLTGGTLGCNADDGLVCGAPDPGTGDSFCEVGVAGELVSLSAIRDSATNTRFIVEGADPNGDALFLFGGFYQEDGTLVTLGGAPFEEGLFALDDNVRGLTEFSTTSTWEFTDVFDQEIAYAEFVLEDTLGLQGETRLQAAIAPLVLEGGACDAAGQGTVDLCEDGTSCIEGTCQSAAPTVTEILVAQNEDNTRLLDITVLGADANEDVETFTFDFFDGEGTSVTGEIAAPAELELPFGITYEDGSFEYTTQLFWNTDDILGVAAGTLVVTDAFGNATDTLDFTFRPTLGFGDTCDLAEEAGICRAGLFCTGDLLCDVDMVDPCGGVELVFADEVGDEDPELGLFVPFNTSGGENVEQANCGEFGPSLGSEVAISWTAPANGELFVTTDTDLTDGFDTYIYAREGFCAEPSSEVACNDDISGTNFTSELLFPVTAGQDYYVFIDFFVDGGSGEALFQFTEAAFEGESCETLPCATGLFCGADNLCAGPAGDGESCAVLPCEDGLFCGPADLCVPPAAPGESCADIPCAAGLICDADLCIEPAGSCDAAETIPSDATTYSTTFSVAFDDHDGANATCAQPNVVAASETVLQWTADVTGDVQIDTLGSDFDTILFASAGACNLTGALIECNDDAFTGLLQSGLLLSATEGTTYFFMVEAYADGADGTETLVVNITRP